MSSRAHLYVSGVVQGVFYRASTRDKARQLGLNGWVRNLPDGRVEAVLEGEEDILKEMLDWCRRGPAGSIVDEVDVRWNEEHESIEGFSIR